MATETFVVDSECSPEEAFDRIIDLSRVVEWDRGIKGSQLTDGERGALGARYDVAVRGFDGELTTVVYELTSVDRPMSFSMVGSHYGFRAEDTATIEPTKTGCRVTYEASLVLLGDPPPMNESQLAKVFRLNVEVARAGLETFLGKPA